LFPRSRHDPETLKPVWMALDRAERDENEKRRLQAAPNMTRSEIVERLRWNLRQFHAPTL
jgi:hypothetical protein